MKLRLFLASVFTLGILFLMFLTLFLTLFFTLGFFDWYFLIGFTIFINFLFWLLGPYLSDLIYTAFYRMRWIGIEGLSKINKNAADFVKDVCKRNRIKVPKIGYIDDDNPTTFTYGSAAFNARIVFTKGIVTYLKPNEIKTVLAHEIGHVVHRDFIVMAVASVVIQLFYEIYRIGLRAAQSRGGGRKKGGAFYIVLAVVGYIFYIIGTYVLLYLSRIREYFADEFAAKETKDPNGLSMALIKTAYGIVKNPEDKRQLDLLKTTRAYNIFDFKIAKTIGLAYVNAAEKRDWAPVEGAILFDKLNPWAFFSEISSTHPLTGKRIGRLSEIAKSLGQRPLFDVQTLIKKYNVEKDKFYVNFFTDLFFLLFPHILSLVSVIAFILINRLQIGLSFIEAVFGLFLLSQGIGILFRTLYSYSTSGGFPKTDVADLMDDIYTSPIRGRPNRLSGKIVGRGVAGLIFSEDMMFQDSTGLIYLNYESLIPFFGNFVFAITKVNDLVGKECEIEGWFVRGLSHWVELNKIYVDKREIKSRVRLLGILASAFLMIIGIVLIF